MIGEQQAIVKDLNQLQFVMNKIVQDITRALNNNERVEVKYKQQLYLFQALHGDTQYFVTEVKLNPIIQGEK